MEDVLDLYAQPYYSETPRICFDENPLVVHEEMREPLPTEQSHPQRSDYEYERLGTANLFAYVELLAGHRSAEMTDRYTSQVILGS
jgi:hypothetical protein